MPCPGSFCKLIVGQATNPCHLIPELSSYPLSYTDFRIIEKMWTCCGINFRKVKWQSPWGLFGLWWPERASSGKDSMPCDEFILSLTASKWHWLLSRANILNHPANGVTEGRDKALVMSGRRTLLWHVRRTKIKLDSHSFHLRKW